MAQILGLPPFATGKEQYRTVAHIIDHQAQLTGDRGFSRFEPFLDCRYKGQQYMVVEAADGEYLVVDVWETRMMHDRPWTFGQALPFVVDRTPDEDTAIAVACLR